MSTLLAVVLAGFVPQTPYVLEDPDIWGEELRGPVPEVRATLPPPIRVEAWRVLAGGEVEAARELERYLRDPARFETRGWLVGNALPAREPIAAAFAQVEVDADQVRLARLPGGVALALRGELFQGDPRRLGLGGVPIALRSGRNELVVFGPSAGFELELAAPATRVVIEPRGAQRRGLGVDVPLFNASTAPIESLHLHYGRGVAAGSAARPALSEFADGGAAPPLGMLLSSFVGFGGEAELTLFPVCAYADGDADADRRLVGVRRRTAAPDDGDPAGDVLPPSALEHAEALLYATGGSEEERAASLARARFEQQRLWYWSGRAPELLADTAWLRAQDARDPHMRRGHVVLFGNADTNAAWSRLLGSEPGFEILRGKARLGDEPARDGDDHAGYVLRHRADAPGTHLKALALFDTGATGARLGARVDPRACPARQGWFRAGSWNHEGHGERGAGRR